MKKNKPLFMFKKINRKDCLDKYPKLPQSDNLSEDFSFPKFFRAYILMLSSKSIKAHAKNLATEILNLIEHLSVDSLVFLGDAETPWLYQENDYQPVKSALEYLSEKKVGRKFIGGFEIGITELRQFITHLFWLVRCNASFPIVHFTNKDQQFIGSICKYGNIHLFTLNKKDDGLLQEALKKSHLTILHGEKCSDQFSKTGRLEGRQTIG
jgi:hypothetical protein